MTVTFELWEETAFLDFKNRFDCFKLEWYTWSLLEQEVSDELLTSTVVNMRTCPVCPWGMPLRSNRKQNCVKFKVFSIPKLPETIGQWFKLVVDEETWGDGSVKIAPALVPIHNKSLQAKSAVILKHADLCWRMISSQAVFRKPKKFI